MCAPQSSGTSSGSSSSPVEHVPGPGEIVAASETWQEAAGGGGGRRRPALAPRGHGALLHGARRRTSSGGARRPSSRSAGSRSRRLRRRAAAQGHHLRRRAGERTITTIGPKLHPRGHDDSYPWRELARCDAVYFCAGDVDALVHARRARVLVATARELGDPADAVGRARRGRREREGRRERYRPGDLDPTPRLERDDVGRARRLGAAGRARSRRRRSRTRPGDAYGAGDCFAAGLAFALGSGTRDSEALAFAARCGAGRDGRAGVHAEAIPLP